MSRARRNLTMAALLLWGVPGHVWLLWRLGWGWRRIARAVVREHWAFWRWYVAR